MSESATHAVITGGQGAVASALAAELMAHDMQVERPGRSDLDVTDEVAVKQYFHERRVDLLICCAGRTDDRVLAKQDEETWDALWSVNYQGALRCAEAAYPMMAKSKHGHVILVSSFSALHPPIGQVAYASAKAALLGLTRDLAVRYGADNIRINAIMPGFLETSMTAKVSHHRKQQVLSHHCLGRYNTPDRVATFIRFLHLEMPHTSGQLFNLDSRLTDW